jgi:dienelactone hydrolase
VIASSAAHLRVPAPTGAFAVGKVVRMLVDSARPASIAATAPGARHVRLVAWYPALTDAGAPAPYVSGLSSIADGLVASGQLTRVETEGLRLVADPARAEAEAAIGSLPVILLSPGNATNVEFYASLAEDLASHGFAVIGLDHPYQVAAVDLGDLVAIYAGDPPLAQAPAVTMANIRERVADIRFVLDRLQVDAAGLTPLNGRLDLTRIGVMGHSNGGIASAEACVDPRLKACANVDGQLAGGPFSASADPSAPTKPFLFLTKETVLHPALAALFEAGGRGVFRVVVPGATHVEFTDGPLFHPRATPLPSSADEVIAVARGFVLAFFDHELRGAPRTVFSKVVAPVDVQVFVYPLIRQTN